MSFKLSDLWGRKKSGATLEDEEAEALNLEIENRGYDPNDLDEEAIAALDEDLKPEDATHGSGMPTAKEIAAEMFNLQKAADDERAETERTRKAEEARKAASSSGETLEQKRTRYLEMVEEAYDGESRRAAASLALEIAREEATADFEKKYASKFDATDQIADQNTWNTAIEGLSAEQVESMQAYMKEKKVIVSELRNPVALDLIRSKAILAVAQKKGTFEEVEVPSVVGARSSSEPKLDKEQSEAVQSIMRQAETLSKRQKAGAKKITVKPNDLVGSN